ncbi:uncharacterized protein LOC105279043 isoform X2 [Ooceraea biroi]|uniref:uncharacterized protein LOC105279043 isoform X2 n=1 Tax=Ooceraea biroi TaxID=2015173 RepID=UPI000F074F9E|nr:uncharacterized protein LOC105279043 isoform X2 [Ooceraea biroi]
MSNMYETASVDMDMANDTDAVNMPVVDRMDVEYKIYVNNLPPELNENAIGEVFGQYGRVTGLFHPPNATWAYITYGSFREAECSIRELNNKKPLYLRVTLAKERSSSREQPCKSQPLPQPRAQKSVTLEDIMSAMQDVAEAANVNIKPNPMLKLNHTLSAIQKDRASKLEDARAPHLEGYNISENEEPFVNTSRLWSRGLMTNVLDKKRRVSFGRGYTGYEVPENDPRIEEYIKKGLYEHLDDKLGSKIKRCLVCSVKTMKHCEKCDTHYCSRACQVKDWPRHQLECERVPALVEEAVDLSSLAIKDEGKKREDQTKEPSANSAQLRRPRTAPMHTESSTNSTNVSASKNSASVNDYTDNAANQRGLPSARYESDAKDAQVKRATDQPAMNTKDISPNPNRSQAFDQINTNTDQSRRNAKSWTPTSANSAYQANRNHVGDVNKSSSPNERFNSGSNMKDRQTYADKRPPYERHEPQNARKPAAHSDRDSNRRSNNVCSNGEVPSDDLAFQKDTYLSKAKFAEVEIVVPLGNGEYWVCRTEDTDARITLMTTLQDVAEQSRNVQPIVGNIYGVLYETIWHRAMVTALNPVRIHFIDFGNEEPLEKGAAIRDIQELSKPARFARKIRLTQSASDRCRKLEYGDKISVRMMSMNPDKTITVEVQGESQAECATKSAPSLSTNVQQKEGGPGAAGQDSAAQPVNVLRVLDNLLSERVLPELEFVGLLQICGPVQSNVYCATLCPYMFTDKLEMILQDLQVECVAMESEFADYKPQLDDCVCGKTKEGWYRGYVPAGSMTPTDLRIISIDEARVVPVEKIMPCPAKFLDICSFGVTCEVTQSTRQLEVGKTYQFTTIIKEHNRAEESLKIDITEVKEDSKDSKGDELVTAVVKPWKPTEAKAQAKSQIPALSELKNGSKICLTNYRNHYFMFGRSLDKEDNEYFHRIMQRVAQAARTAPYLSDSQNIEKSQMVIAPFDDGNCYRAMVTAVQDDKAKIIYVDFGNISEIGVKELQVLPDNLRMERSCAAKIYLKNVPRDVPITKDVDAYLRHLLAEEVSLTCTHDGAPLKDGINLTMPSGESVNDKINQLLQPNWKQEDYDDKTCYMLGDMQIANLGNVGDTVDALVLLIQEDERKYLMLAPIDIDLVTHITEVMPPQMKEFCESTEYYIPRACELCLALYEGAWYRAACLVPEVKKGLAQIFFIDYGNTDPVEHKNIRMMPKDFVEPAAMANMCTIVNLAPTNPDGNYSPAVQQALAELTPMESTVRIKIVDFPESGDYKVELPDIRAALIKQGLVSS